MSCARVRGNPLRYGRCLVCRFEWNLAVTELNLSLVPSLDLVSVLCVGRKETNTAISIIKKITMAVSQIEPANMSSGRRLCCGIDGPFMDSDPT